MSGRPSISGVVLAQDNADRIGAVLDQLGALCDEVIVVDGGSRDATFEIAAARPFARVFRRPFDSFPRQRNFALDQARGRWILSLDTDERLSDDALWRIPRLVRVPWLSRFHLPRLWLVRHAGRLHYLGAKPYYRDRQLRLFRNHPTRRYAETPAVHERLSDREFGFGRRLKTPVLFHFCLLQERARREQKVARYAALNPDAARVNGFYLWEELVRQHGIPLVPLPECYQRRFHADALATARAEARRPRRGATEQLPGAPRI